MDFSVHAVAPKEDTFSLSLGVASLVMSLVRHISRLLLVLVVGVMALEMSPGSARSVQGISGGLLVRPEVVRVISVGAAV